MEKNEIVDSKELKTEKSIIHLQGAISAHNLEDFVSSLGVIIVSVIFILYVAIVSLIPAAFSSKQSSTFGKTGSNSMFPFFTKQPDCKKMNGNFDACVKSQAEGSGCSWYADCNLCIAGGHEGKSREELCGNK